MTTQAPLSSICADQTNQPRLDDLDGAHIEHLKEAVESWPPLVVVSDGGNGFILVDGFHRLTAAKELGLETVPVQVVDAAADDDLLPLAFDLNSKHGLPLTLDDRRAFARYLLESDPSGSDRSLGKRCGLSAATIAKIRSALESDGTIQPKEERVGSDGRTYSPPPRQPGELPTQGLVQFIGDGLRGMVTDEQTRNQRKLVRYLQRLLVALEDQYEFTAWEKAENAAFACDMVLGPYDSAELVNRLTVCAQRIVDIGKFLKSVA